MQGCFLDHSHVFFKHSSHIVELLRTRLDPSVECYLMKKRLNCLKRQKKIEIEKASNAWNDLKLLLSSNTRLHKNQDTVDCIWLKKKPKIARLIDTWIRLNTYLYDILKSVFDKPLPSTRHTYPNAIRSEKKKDI